MQQEGERLKTYLDKLADKYNRPEFIEKDPISIPHGFSIKQDIEISGLFAALFAWGNRTTIINKGQELMQLMDNAPYDFIMNHREHDLKNFLKFKHRTFNATDLLYFISFLKRHYSAYNSLEDAFFPDHIHTVEEGLNYFRKNFINHAYFPQRTGKHVSSPDKNSSCKRLNMFLRWMVRKDDRGVDFGIWQKIKPFQLIIPLDVHVFRVSASLGLLNTKNSDWKAALQLTETLKTYNPEDPVLYDFALFGLGGIEKVKI